MLFLSCTPSPETPSTPSGRKKAALLYVITYALSCATKHSPNYQILMVGPAALASKGLPHPRPTHLYRGLEAFPGNVRTVPKYLRWHVPCCKPLSPCALAYGPPCCLGWAAVGRHRHLAAVLRL